MIQFNLEERKPINAGFSVNVQSAKGTVRYDTPQELTDEQQAQAVQNIGMNADSADAMWLLSESGLVTPMYENGVFYTAKTGEIFTI